MRCSNCGAPRGRSDVFCPRCGWHFADGTGREVIIPPRRAVVPYHLDRAVLIGGATTAGLSAAWLAARWLLPRVLSRLARAAGSKPEPPVAAPEGGMQLEMQLWMRRVIIRRK